MEMMNQGPRSWSNVRKERGRARFVDSDKFGFVHRFSFSFFAPLLLHDWVNREFPYLP